MLHERNSEDGPDTLTWPRKIVTMWIVTESERQ